MTEVSGSLKLVTGSPAAVSQVWLRAPNGRVQGSEYVTEAPDTVPVTGGEVSFDALPGAMVMTLISHGSPTHTVKLLVPDKTSATLAECIEAAELATDGTRSALERLALEVQAELGQVPALVSDALAQDSTIIDAVRQVVSSYTGTGSPEGKVAAPVGSTYTDTEATNGAIRWVKSSDTGNTGWVVEYGNTGIRNITSLIDGDTGAGTARIQRIGNTVMLSLKNIPTPGDGVYMSIPNFIPVGFRSAFSWQHLGIGKSASIDATGPLRIGTNGDLYIYRSPSETRINGTVTYISDTPWPTTLPGAPA